MTDQNVIDLTTRRRAVAARRLLDAAQRALDVLDTMPLSELAEGGDSEVRAALKAAIDEVKDLL